MNQSRFHGMPCQGSRLPFAQLGLVGFQKRPTEGFGEEDFPVFFGVLGEFWGVIFVKSLCTFAVA